MSTIQQELNQLGDNPSLSDIQNAVGRIQSTAGEEKFQVTYEFLGAAAEQLDLPGLYTLPTGRRYVPAGESEPAEEDDPSAARYLARIGLLPNGARERIEQDPSRGDDFEPLPGTETDVANRPPRNDPDVEDEPTDSDSEQETDAETSNSLADFAQSDKGGLANDPDETAAIEELQTFLVNELGLNTGGIDGRYGPRTTDAVREFQDALTDITVDGDAGPETIGKIQEIRTDTQRIQELLDALNESALPFAFKSGLAQLLERDLTQAERQELQTLLDKYEDFRQEFPEFRQETFAQAETAITDQPEPQDDRSAAAQAADPDGDLNADDPEAQTFVSDRPQTQSDAPEGPYVQGMVITPEIQEQLRTIERDPGMSGERLTGDDIRALNIAVADGRIEEPDFTRDTADAEFTGDVETDITQLYQSSRDPNTAQEFVDAYEDVTDQRVLRNLEQRMNRLIQTLLGNTRVPDNIENVGGEILRGTPRQTINVLTSFRDDLLRRRFANPPADDSPEQSSTDSANASTISPGQQSVLDQLPISDSKELNRVLNITRRLLGG